MLTWKWLAPLVTAIAMATPCFVNAQIYKWVDANGNTQFGTAPPQVDAQEITTKISKSTDQQTEATVESKPTAITNTELRPADLLGSWHSSKGNEKSDWTFKPGGIFTGLMIDSIGKVVKTGTYKIDGNQITINTTNTIDDAFGKRTVSSREEFTVLNFEKDTLVIQIDDQGFITKPAPYTFKRK